MQWQEKGLDIPESVQYTTDNYRTDQDSLGRFLETECIIDYDEKISVSKMYDYYMTWADTDGVKRLSKTEFRRKMEERFNKQRYADGYYYLGVTNKPTIEDELFQVYQESKKASN